MIYWTSFSPWKVVVGSGSKRWAPSHGRPRLPPRGFLQLSFYGFFFKKPNTLRLKKIGFYLGLFGFCVKTNKSNATAKTKIKPKKVFPPLMVIAG
jgi:hypothetical protein